jgi:hypothetical protein
MMRVRASQGTSSLDACAGVKKAIADGCSSVVLLPLQLVLDLSTLLVLVNVHPRHLRLKALLDRTRRVGRARIELAVLLIVEVL